MVILPHARNGSTAPQMRLLALCLAPPSLPCSVCRRPGMYPETYALVFLTTKESGRLPN